MVAAEVRPPGCRGRSGACPLTSHVESGGFSVGRWFGFPVRIDYSWFFVFLLVVWTFTEREFPAQLPGLSETTYALMGTAAAVLFFVSVLLHEFAHAGMAQARGIHVTRITLFIFGGLAELRSEPRRPADEFLITVVGPLASLTLAAIFYGLLTAAHSLGLPASLAVVARFLAVMNLVLAIFNMVPAFPLDGGRLLRAVLWKVTGNPHRATRWSAMLGKGFGLTLLAYGGFLVVRGQLFAGGWSAMIGWFLYSAARGATRQYGLRQLLASSSLRDVPSVDHPGAPEEPLPGLASAPVLEAADTLEEALLIMHESGTDRVHVVEFAGAPPRVVTLRDLDGWFTARQARQAASG
ncbi:MAG: site-2 protease family protein [Gemmatimonadota bacterium]